VAQARAFVAWAEAFRIYFVGDSGDGVMRVWLEALSRLCRDETGGETLEYALVAGLIVIGAISVIGKVGTKVAAKWASLNSSL
jgi:Flp pilus assembly pilin Flp